MKLSLYQQPETHSGKADGLAGFSDPQKETRHSRADTQTPSTTGLQAFDTFAQKPEEMYNEYKSG